jgi:Xaa-Pro aminopeptidase
MSKRFPTGSHDLPVTPALEEFMRTQTRAAEHLDGTLAPGHVLTVEPGLYFQPDDALTPEELRGMGFRIEEDMDWVCRTS